MTLLLLFSLSRDLIPVSFAAMVLASGREGTDTSAQTRIPQTVPLCFSLEIYFVGWNSKTMLKRGAFDGVVAPPRPSSGDDRETRKARL
jgi:hypothetical protein